MFRDVARPRVRAVTVALPETTARSRIAHVYRACATALQTWKFDDSFAAHHVAVVLHSEAQRQHGARQMNNQIAKFAEQSRRLAERVETACATATSLRACELLPHRGDVQAVQLAAALPCLAAHCHCYVGIGRQSAFRFRRESSFVRQEELC